MNLHKLVLIYGYTELLNTEINANSSLKTVLTFSAFRVYTALDRVLALPSLEYSNYTSLGYVITLIFVILPIILTADFAIYLILFR
jgi:hypothetical protein